MIFKYILLGFIFAAGIGPVNIETAKRGVTHYSFSALLFYLGNVIIDALYILLIMFGFSVLVEDPIIKITFGIFGILYLLYIGISDVKDYFQKNIFIDNQTIKKKKLNPILEGILVNLANPMAIASWLAFYSVISDEFGKSILNFFAVILGAILVGLVIVMITYLCKKIVSEKIMRIISLISGLILVGFSVFFAYKLLFTL